MDRTERVNLLHGLLSSHPRGLSQERLLREAGCSRIHKLVGARAFRLDRLRVLRTQARSGDQTVCRLVTEAVLAARQLRFEYRARSTARASERVVQPAFLTPVADDREGLCAERKARRRGMALPLRGGATLRSAQRTSEGREAKRCSRQTVIAAVISKPDCGLTKQASFRAGVRNAG